MQFDGSPFTPAQLTVRASLLAGRGSRLCDQPGCQVITQGGYPGENSHMAKIHPEVKRARPGEGTEIS